VFCSRCGTWASEEATHCPLCGSSLRGDGTTVPPHAAAAHGVTAGAMPALQYAGFWRRFAAVLLDSALLWFPTATARAVLGLDPFAPFDPQTPAVWVSMGLEYLLGWLYAALWISSGSRGTLGHQVMGLYVSDLHGNRISFAHATGRYLAQLLTLFTLGLGYLLQLATPRRQTLHDWVSRTLVLRAHAELPTVLAPPLRMAP
jgi:uncharacterized RDD family membrane protein YckC